MRLANFLEVIDGGEVIRVYDYNTHYVLYAGKKADCPAIDARVMGVWTLTTSGEARMVIEVVE
jgi:hypothetical protein